MARNRGLAEAAVRDTEAGLYFGSDAVNTRLADRMGTRQDALADLRAAIESRFSTRAALSAPIQPKGETTMNQETEVQAEPKQPAVDVEAIRTEARRQGYAEAREIVELCGLAGLPDEARWRCWRAMLSPPRPASTSSPSGLSRIRPRSVRT